MSESRLVAFSTDIYLYNELDRHRDEICCIMQEGARRRSMKDGERICIDGDLYEATPEGWESPRVRAMRRREKKLLCPSCGGSGL